MPQVADFLKPSPIVDANQPVSQVIDQMVSRDRTDLLVFEDKKFLGILTYHSLLDVTGPSATKVRNLVFHPHLLAKTDTLETAAHFFVELGTQLLPISEKGKIAGVIYANDVLSAANLAGLTVTDAMTFNPKTIKLGTSAAVARALMKSLGINRLLVVDEKGKLVGIVTSLDFIRRLAPKEKPHAGDRRGVKNPTYDLPLDAFMSSNILSCKPTDDLTAVAATMVKNRVHVLPVLDGENLMGLVSRKGILKLIQPGGPAGVSIDLAGVHHLETFELATIKDELASFAKKLGKSLGPSHLHVSLKKVGSGKVEVHLKVTQKNSFFVVFATGFDAPSAVTQVLRIAERRIRHD